MKILSVKSLIIIIATSSNIALSSEIPIFSGNKKHFSFEKGKDYQIKFKNHGAKIDYCKSYPDLPEGFSLSTDCIITGVAKESQSMILYEIVAFRKNHGSYNLPITITIYP